jgi:hypothetical protein
MSLWNLTLPNLVSYAIVGSLWLLALVHAFAARERNRELAMAEHEFERRIGPLLQRLLRGNGEGDGARELVVLFTTLRELRSPHPSAAVLLQACQEPEVVHDDLTVTSWIAAAIQGQLGALKTSMERVRSIAPVVGITGTIGGFLIATWVFARAHDQTQLMSGIALSLVTTLVSGIIVLIERWVLEGTMDPLELRLYLHCQIMVARARVWLAQSKNHHLTPQPSVRPPDQLGRELTMGEALQRRDLEAR